MKKPLAMALPLLLAAQTGFAAWNPPDWELKAPAVQEGATNPGSVFLNGALAFYRGAAGPVLGGRCPSYPSCSAYALEAVKMHGPLEGSILTAARLVSEADEAAFAPRIVLNGRPLVFDPVPATLIHKEAAR